MMYCTYNIIEYKTKIIPIFLSTSLTYYIILDYIILYYVLAETELNI